MHIRDVTRKYYKSLVKRELRSRLARSTGNEARKRSENETKVGSRILDSREELRETKKREAKREKHDEEGGGKMNREEDT